jgi:hypothetical protein
MILFVSARSYFTDIGLAIDVIDTKIPSDAKIKKTFAHYGHFTGDGAYFTVISLNEENNRFKLECIIVVWIRENGRRTEFEKRDVFFP